MGNSRRFRRKLVIAPEVPEDGSAEIREGIARRRVVATTGRCPCGARLELPEKVSVDRSWSFGLNMSPTVRPPRRPSTLRWVRTDGSCAGSDHHHRTRRNPHIRP